MSKNKSKDVSDYDRRAGQDLPRGPVVSDTDIEPKGKDNEIVMPERTEEANIARARKLADENSAHDQAVNRQEGDDGRDHKLNDVDSTRSDV